MDQTLNLLMPYIIMNNNFNEYTVLKMITIPIIFWIIKQLYNKLHNLIREEHSVCIYKVDTSNLYRFHENKIYNYITHFIEENNSAFNIKNITSDSTYTRFDQPIGLFDGATFYKKYPKFEIVDTKPIYYKIDMYNYVKIEKKRRVVSKEITDLHQDKLLYYDISAKNKRSLKIFMEKIYDSDISYYKKIYANKLPMYHIYHEDWTELKFNNNKNFNNIFLEQSLITFIKERIDMLQDGAIYKKIGMTQRLGFLFYGIPGSGKTSIIFAIANHYNKQIYNINLKLSRVKFFKQIISIPENSIVIFNDLDTIKVTNKRNIEDNTDTKNKKKDKDNENDNDCIILADLLEILDGYAYLDKCIIIMTTNHIEKLDEALIRPGRIDHKIEFTYATNNQINQILKYYYKNYGTNSHNFTKTNINISYLINTVILPNLDDVDVVLDYLLK